MNTAQHCKSRMTWPLSPVAMSLCLVCWGVTGKVNARDYFDPSFLGGGKGNVDLSAFESAGYVPPGRYLVDVYVNRTLVESRTLTFQTVDGQTKPMLTVADLTQWGIDADKVPALKGKAPTTAVKSLSAIIPKADSRFDLSHLRLDLSVPQIAMRDGAEDGMNPALWDEGIPALLVNYNINGGEGKYSASDGTGTRTHNLFASFRDGLNVGAWRLRSTQMYTYNNQESTGEDPWGQKRPSAPVQSGWQNSDTYVQRDIQSLRAMLTMGEGSSGGAILDGVPFRGIQLTSEDSMLPNSSQGFSPVITGTANSNAVVRVKQNGNTVYQINVAPGPFRITDMPTLGNTGDLQVEVTEADGSRHVSTVAYSSLPLMQRQGRMDYEVTAGKYHAGSVTDGSREPNFMMATLVYGLPGNITLYGGALGASDYHSAVLGSAFSLGDFGAMSFDATMARARLEDVNGGNSKDETGTSYRVRYSKSMLATGTSFDLATYRYSTRNYYSFSDTNSYGYDLNDWTAPWTLDRQRSSWTVSVNQQLPWQLGSVYVSGTRTSYWDDSNNNKSMSLGYTVMVKNIPLSLNYDVDKIQRNDDSWQQNRQLSFNTSIPFSLFSHSDALQSMSMSYSMTHNNEGQVTQQAGLNGSLPGGKLSYGLNQGWGNSGMQDSTSGNLSWQGSRLTGNSAYSQSSGNKNLSYGISGGMLLHQYGLTFTRMLGDGGILVHAPGAAGVKVNGYDQTDWWGNTVLPAGSSYRKNSVTIDPSTLPDGVDITRNSQNVYPTRGAVVLAGYQVRKGSQLLLNLVHDGRAVPFGAIAALAGSSDAAASGIVGDGGRVYLTGMPARGEVRVSWGREAGQSCTAHYQGGEGQLIVLDKVACR